MICAKVLEDLSSTWWSANTMAKLARKAMLELDKVINSDSKRGSLASVSGLPQNRPALSHKRLNHGEPIANSVQPLQAPPEQYSPQNRSNNISHAEMAGVPNGSQSTNIDNREAYPFDLNVSYPPQDFMANQAEIENIDAFLGNFLDLQSSRINEDPSFVDYMDELSQEYFNEMARSTQPLGPATGVGNGPAS